MSTDDPRGEYRTIHVAMLDDQDFIVLSPDARFVLMILKLELGRAGIDTVYPGKIEWHTGLSFEAVDFALRELIEKRWIEMENRVIWLRNGLKYEVTQNLNNGNHLRGIAMQLQRLPRYQICKRWCAYYRLALPGVATIRDVREIAPQLMREYHGLEVEFDDNMDMRVIGEIEVPEMKVGATNGVPNIMLRKENPTILDGFSDGFADGVDDDMGEAEECLGIEDGMVDATPDGMGDASPEVSPSIIQIQKQKQIINEESAAPAPPKRAKGIKFIAFTSDDMECAKLLHSQIALAFPGYAESMPTNLDAWANEFRLIRTADRRKLGDVVHVLENFIAHPFWSKKIRSPGMLRGKTRQGADRFMVIRYDLENPDGKKTGRSNDHVASGDEYGYLANRYPADPRDSAAPDGGDHELRTVDGTDGAGEIGPKPCGAVDHGPVRDGNGHLPDD